MTSGSSRGRLPNSHPRLHTSLKDFGVQKSSEDIIDLTVPKKRPHPVASTLVDYRIAAKYSNTLTFKHVLAPLDISNNAGRKHSNIK